MVTRAIVRIEFGDRVRTYSDRFTSESCWELIVAGERGGVGAW